MATMDPDSMTHESTQVAAIRCTAAGRAERQAGALARQQVAQGVYAGWAASCPPDHPSHRELDALLTQLRATWTRRHRTWVQTCALAYDSVEQWPDIPVLTTAEVEDIRGRLTIDLALCPDAPTFNPDAEG